MWRTACELRFLARASPVSRSLNKNIAALNSCAFSPAVWRAPARPAPCNHGSLDAHIICPSSLSTTRGRVQCSYLYRKLKWLWLFICHDELIRCLSGGNSPATSKSSTISCSSAAVGAGCAQGNVRLVCVSQKLLRWRTMHSEGCTHVGVHEPMSRKQGAVNL